MTQNRVAIQLISTGGVYGAERALLELAAYLHDHGWESHVVALEGRGAAELVARASQRGLAAEAFVPQGRLGLVPMLGRLRNLLERYPRAIVHSHGYKPDILLSMLGAPRRLACVATCHNWISETLRLKAWEALDKRALRKFDRIMAVSDGVHRRLLAGGVPPERIHQVSNGISPPVAGPQARERIRTELGLPPAARLIIQIGRLTRSKRNDLLLEAVARLPPGLGAHVALVGEGEQHFSLVNAARRLQLERQVHFCGYRSDIADFLAAADVLALTSDIEAMPIVVLEAMAARCPIVSTKVGSVPRILQAGVECWLVAVNEVAGLAAAIDQALSQPSEAHSRAERAYATFVTRYSQAAMGEQYMSIYDEVWRRRGWP